MVTYIKRSYCVLLSCDIVPVLLLSLEFPIDTSVVISCNIRCMLSYRAIITVLFLYLKCPLTTSVFISFQPYRCRCLSDPYIANHTDRTQTKVLYLPR